MSKKSVASPTTRLADVLERLEQQAELLSLAIAGLGALGHGSSLPESAYMVVKGQADHVRDLVSQARTEA